MLSRFLAADGAVERKLGHMYKRVEELEDEPRAPRTAFVSGKNLGDRENRLVGSLTVLPTVIAAGTVVASAGAVAAAIVGTAIAVVVDPGKAGPGMHIHKFDQYYCVLEGEMTVEVALQKHVVGPGTLVVLPAGVPHCQYNAGEATERHLVVLAPCPLPGEPWDEGVDFIANGETHTGSNILVPQS